MFLYQLVIFQIKFLINDKFKYYDDICGIYYQNSKTEIKINTFTVMQKYL